MGGGPGGGRRGATAPPSLSANILVTTIFCNKFRLTFFVNLMDTIFNYDSVTTIPPDFLYKNQEGASLFTL